MTAHLDIEVVRSQLERDGFAMIERYLDPSSLELVKARLDDHFRSAGEHPGRSPRGQKLEIGHLVSGDPRLSNSDVFLRTRELARKLMGRPVFRSFDHAIYKEPGSSTIDWHQDDAYKSSVREMRSLHFWIPLQDTSEPDGCMRYIRGSHRGPVLSHARDQLGNLSVDSNLLDQTAIASCEMSLGDVLVHTPRTVHGSFAVTSGEIRRAWILHFGPYGRLEPLLPLNLLHNLTRRVKSALGALMNENRG